MVLHHCDSMTFQLNWHPKESFTASSKVLFKKKKENKGEGINQIHQNKAIGNDFLKKSIFFFEKY